MTYAASGMIAYSDTQPETFEMDGQNPYATSSMQDPAKSAYYNSNLSCDIKPRLTKEQHDMLEAEYQKQNKPNTSTKKAFADALHVSLDKVNNWFQNRRAKSKQDAKKLAGAYNLYAQQPNSGFFNYDSDTSPAFASSDYFSMMQQCASDDQLCNEIGMGQQFQEQASMHGLPFMHGDVNSGHLAAAAMPQHLTHDTFDNSLDLNRRTLTQEQFDAFAQHGGMMQSSGQFDSLHQGFSGDANVLQQVFPDMQQDHFKRQDVFAFTNAMGAPISSNDSTIPSTISEQSNFPSSNGMLESTIVSSVPDFVDSCTSSVSGHEPQFEHIHPPPPHTVATSSQWQPGQSVPVDPNALQQQFREVEQRQLLQQQQQQQQSLVQPNPQHEQPLAWPDDAYVRRDSQSSAILAQQMSNFAIHTPQPPQSAAFKAPPPPASIAARRQRPRPAALGLASLRSQSYSGAVQPNSPSQGHHNLTPGQPLRRIRSSNVINGVATGRVTKGAPGPAQRSPLSFSFADAMNSPKAIRHASSSSTMNLAPPTPLSPPDDVQAQAQEQQQQQQTQQHHSRHGVHAWQFSAGQFLQQDSISETDAEHNVPYVPPTSVPPHPTFTSPPHTPMYQQHPQHPALQFVQGHPGHGSAIENTPPQSAPASQQTFFAAPPPHFSHVVQSQAPMQAPPAKQVQELMPPPPQHHIVNGVAPEQQSFHPPQVFPPLPPQSQQQQYHVPRTSASPERIQFQFANGVPVVNAQGQLTMAFPQPVPMQPVSHVQYVPPPAAAPIPMQPFSPPVPTQYSFVTSDGLSPATMAAHLPKPPPPPPAEFFVHEYSPPQDPKRAATPRKPSGVDMGPKNYTFANHGPEHFEKGGKKSSIDSKAGSVASSSPASSTT